MYHGLDNRFLYSAYQLHCIHANDAGQLIECSGTGFWLQNNDASPILVTNRHVVDLEYADCKYAGFRLQKLVVSGKAIDKSSGRPDIPVSLEAVQLKANFSDSPENDVACLEILRYFTTDGFPKPTISYPIPRKFLATREDFESEFSVCDFVAFPGFPEWHDKRELRPILRTGTISSDPRYDYSSSSNYEGELIAYEAFSFGGSSGSPVFAVQKGPKPGVGIDFPGFRELKLIGINGGHLYISEENQGHSGISYMYKSSAILDILAWDLSPPGDPSERS